MHKLSLPATEQERKQALAYLLNVQLMILQSMALEKAADERPRTRRPE
jgi:hypothetical protein